MKKSLPIIIFLLSYYNTSAQTTISGSIGGMIFKPSGNPWLVTENIFIESDSKTVVEPGCVFLFKPFTGIIVHGTFIVEGEKERPVIFSSINDSTYSETAVKKPEPFDWNGIIVENEAVAVILSHFKLSYSVYGIKSKISNLTITSGLFRQNGQFHFTIKDKIQGVESNLPFNYNNQNFKKEASPKSLSGDRSWVQPVGIGTIALGTVVLGIMGYFIYSATEYNRKYENAGKYVDIQKYLDKRDDAATSALIIGIVGGILVPTGTGLLVWEHKTKGTKKSVSMYPVTGEANGVRIVMKF